MNLDNLKENLIQINDLIKSSLKEIEHYKKENDILLKLLQEKEKEIEELKDKFSIELNLKDEEINKHSTELNNFSKVSMVVSLNKELEEKNKQIKLLETQLQTFKKDEKPKKQSNTKKEIEKEEIIENYIFDPNCFEELDGYELIRYKKQYYLRDLETSELYDIFNNKPNNKIGYIQVNGKVKLN